MTYSVSSAFVDESLKQTSSPIRKFSIGAGDYSDRVIKWPTITKEWDRPKPVTVSVDLSNADKGMNFLHQDKTLLTSKCKILIGYDQGEPYSFDSIGYTGDSVGTMSGGQPYGIFFKADGTKFYTTQITGETINQFSMSTPWDIPNLVNDSVSADVSADGVFLTGCWFSPDGLKMYASFVDDKIVEYDLLPAWDLSTAALSYSYNINSVIGGGQPYGMCFNSAGDKLYISTRSTVDAFFMFELGTAWDLSTAGYTSGDTYDFSVDGVQGAGQPAISSDGLVLFLSDSNRDMILKYEMSVAYDLSTLSYSDIAHEVLDVYDSDVLGAVGVNGLFFRSDTNKFYAQAVHAPVLYEYDGYEMITVFSGTLDTVKYSKGKCNLRVIDKMKQLSDRLIGDRETPVSYSGALLSDIAWWAVTSYGGYDVTTSTANNDIDWDQFMSWAAIMSGDNLTASTNFEGIKITEVLRKIARMSHSAVYIEEDKLVFSRFGVTNEPDINVTGDMVLDSVLSVKESDIINKQFVNAIYSTTSNYFQAVVFDVVTASVNSYGLKEHVEEDNSIWYTTSASAINLAQRKTFTQGDPVDVVTVTTPLTTITKQLGDTIYFEDNQIEVAENYRIMRRGVDTNNGKIALTIDRSQLVSAFILDVTSLDGAEVLT